MAEEISDDRFKSEVIRLVSTAIRKIDGLENKVDGLENKVDKNTNEIRILSGQFADVVNTVIKDNQRITKLEKEVEGLQSDIH